MADDDDYKKLPSDEKVSHKNWKARVEGYEELEKAFILIDKDKEFTKYLDLVKKFPVESNAAAQEKALSATLTYVQNTNQSAKILTDVVSGIVQKVLNARPKAKQLGTDICLMYIEIEKSEQVMEEIMKGLENKQPKIVAACAEIILQALREFGAKVVSIKGIVKAVPKLLDHSDKSVRDQAKALAVELYRWVRDGIKPSLQSIKPVQMKELEDEWVKLDPSPPVPIRFTRSQMAKMADSGGAMSTDGVGAVPGPSCAPGQAGVAIDPYDLLEAVDIISKLPADFYDNLVHTKWQTRKEALEALEKLACSPKIEPGQFGDLITALKKAIAKDSNVMVVALAAKCIAGIASGLRKKFAPYAGTIIPALLEKFKEKKSNVVSALREAIDAAFFSTNFTNISEDLTAALNDKNPSVKEESCKFVGRMFLKMNATTLTKQILKQLGGELAKRMDDTTGPVRDAASEALGSAMFIVGEKQLLPLLDQLDAVRQTKIKEQHDKIKSEMKPAATIAAAPAAALVPTIAPKTGTSKSVQAKQPQERPTTSAHGKPEGNAPKKGRPKTTVPASEEPKHQAKAPKKSTNPYEIDLEDPKEPDLGDEVVDAKATEILGEDILKQLASANWKDRLSGVEEMTKKVELMDGGPGMPSQVLIRVLARKPGWKDNNVQVLKAKFLCVTAITKQSKPMSRRSGLHAFEGLSDKLGDAKLKDPVRDALTAIAESISVNFVCYKIAKAGEDSKNPKLQAEALSWISDAIKDFGFKIDLKPQIAFIKNSLQHINADVRKAAILLTGTLFLYIGPNLRVFFEDEKPALLQQIDAEFERLKDQKPPMPTRGIVEGEDTTQEVDTTSSQVVNLADMVERVDISPKITEELLTELGDKNWKVRNEALLKVSAIISEAKFIETNLGDLPAVLKSRLGDPNKNLVLSSLATCTALAVSGGRGMVKHKSILLPAIMLTCTDSKPQVHTAAVEALEAWLKEIGFREFLEGDILLEVLKNENPNLRAELLGWIAQKLPKEKKLPNDLLSALVPIIISALSDRNPDVRKKSQEIITPMAVHIGLDVFNKASTKLDPSSKAGLMQVLEKSSEEVKAIKASSRPAPSRVEGAAAAAVAAAAVVAVATDAPSHEANVAAVAPKQPSKEIAGPKIAKSLSKGSLGPDPSETGKPTDASKKTARSTLSSSQAPSKGKETATEAPVGPMISSKPGAKDIRIKDEQSLKILKWNFTTPRDEYVTQLKEQMTTVCSPSLLTNLFHADFKMHIAAIQSLIQCGEGSDPTLRKALVGNLDLLLKWATIRFFDTNPVVHSKILEFLEMVFKILVDDNYDMPEYEASAFFPYLLQKIGDSKDNIRKSIHHILRLSCDVYPYSKLFNYLMSALESKNSKTRAECLDEISYLIKTFNLVSSLPVAKALKDIAKQIADRDNGVRSAALNTLVEAHKIIGDQVYVHIGKIEKKDLDMLEERIKRSSGKPTSQQQQPAAAPTAVAESANTTMVIRPITAPTTAARKGEATAPDKKEPSKLPSRTLLATTQTIQPPKVSLKTQDEEPSQPPLKKEFSLNLAAIEENMDCTVVPMPKLQSVDESLFKPFDKMPKRSYQGAGTAAHAKDVDVLMNFAIAQVTSQDVPTALNALVQLEEVIRANKAQTVNTRIDQYLVAITMQLRLFMGSRLDSAGLLEQDNVALLKALFSGLLLVFSDPELPLSASSSSLKELFAAMLHLLLDSRLQRSDEHAFVEKVINVIVARVLQSSDQNACFSAIISLIQDSLALDGFSLKIRELVLNCFSRLIKLLPTTIAKIKIEKLLLDCHSFFVQFPSAYWVNAADLMPQKAVRSLLRKLTNLLGTEILSKFVLIPDRTVSEAYMYTVKQIKALGTRPAVPAVNTVVVTPNSDLMKQAMDRLASMLSSRPTPADATADLKCARDLHIATIKGPAKTYIEQLNKLVGGRINNSNQKTASNYEDDPPIIHSEHKTENTTDAEPEKQTLAAVEPAAPIPRSAASTTDSSLDDIRQRLARLRSSVGGGGGKA